MVLEEDEEEDEDDASADSDFSFAKYSETRAITSLKFCCIFSSSSSAVSRSRPRKFSGQGLSAPPFTSENRANGYSIKQLHQGQLTPVLETETRHATADCVSQSEHHGMQ
eukprot:TRINITY_DN2274_c0_g1_i1.p1 TRINITY_DN2274_c0_g1~~TRINITY_DN2274_c0_g1_i1.p1  ORF type:complete len:110 (-),score=29.64 TRINITY_DN2274_c0_g1_i1:162-491(-)